MPVAPTVMWPTRGLHQTRLVWVRSSLAEVRVLGVLGPSWAHYNGTECAVITVDGCPFWSWPRL